MAIFLTENSKVIVQGITGSEGTKHTRRMVASGTNVVGGVNPRKAGSDVDGIPVFATVGEAMKETGADVSVVFVPPAFAKDAAVEAIDAQIPLLVVITEGIPVQDTAYFFAYSRERATTRIIGPNCPGIISPGRSNAGIIPADITRQGRIGLVSKSGTLTYQMMYELRDIGFSTCVGIGGDPVVGTTHIDCLAAFQDDPETDAIGRPSSSRPTSPSPSSATSPGSRHPRARRWGTPAPSSPARVARLPPSRRRSRRSASVSARHRRRPHG